LKTSKVALEEKIPEVAPQQTIQSPSKSPGTPSQRMRPSPTIKTAESSLDQTDFESQEAPPITPTNAKPRSRPSSADKLEFQSPKYRNSIKLESKPQKSESLIPVRFLPQIHLCNSECSSHLLGCWRGKSILRR
jgi:hypothetical protein